MARWPGSVHDERIFDDSCLCAQLERGDIEGILLGDGGDACRPYMMTPIINPLTGPERRYNASHIRTRNTVERMFGKWKGLFSWLSMSLRTSDHFDHHYRHGNSLQFLKARNDPMENLHPQYGPNQSEENLPGWVMQRDVP